MATHNNIIDHIAGSTIIRHTGIDPALLEVDAVVEEQDTDLILGQSPVIRETVESLPDLLKRMEQQIRETPGSVIVRHSTPRRFVAIVYDINHTPICLESWVEQALATILEHCGEYGIRTLAMPLLGTSHGTLRPETMLHMLQNLLIRGRPAYPRHILIYRLD